MAEAIQLPFQLAQAGLDIRTAQKEGVAAEAIGEFNADISRRQGEAGLKRRTEEARLLRRKARKIRGSNVAKGAPLALLEEAAINAQIDELRVLEEGVIASAAGESQAQLDLFQGKIGKKAADRKIIASVLKAGGQTAGAGFSLALPKLGGLKAKGGGLI